MIAPDHQPDPLEKAHTEAEAGNKSRDPSEAEIRLAPAASVIQGEFVRARGRRL
jgi:hypothetical protein